MTRTWHQQREHEATLASIVDVRVARASWVKELADTGQSIAESARQIGWHRASLAREAIKHDITFPGKGKGIGGPGPDPKIKKTDLAGVILKRMDLSAIATLFGVSKTAISNAIRRYDLPSPYRLARAAKTDAVARRGGF